MSARRLVLFAVVELIARILFALIPLAVTIAIVNLDWILVDWENVSIGMNASVRDSNGPWTTNRSLLSSKLLSTNPTLVVPMNVMTIASA